MNPSSVQSALRAGLRWLPIAAALVFVVAVIGFGAALGGYSQAEHPVALLGAQGLPRAGLFNLFGFVLPGVLAACFAIALRASQAKTSALPLRLGAQLLLLAALAFMAMGVFALKLDPRFVLDDDASRVHGAMWLLWLVAFVLAALAFAIGGWKDEKRLASATFAVAFGALLFSLLLPGALLPGVSQRLAFALWWFWLVGIGLHSGR